MSEPTTPAWAATYLPPIPDDAEPIWKSEGVALRGEFPARLVATLIDTIPLIALTIGIIVMKLRVVPNADPKGRITMANAVLRQLGHLANFGVGYLLILGDERKAVQDYVSDSQVIQVGR